MDYYSLNCPPGSIQIEYFSQIWQTFVDCGYYEPGEDDAVVFIAQSELHVTKDNNYNFILRLKNATGNIIDMD